MSLTNLERDRTSANIVRSSGQGQAGSRLAHAAQVARLTTMTRNLTPREHPYHVYLASLGASTRRSVASRLDIAARLLTAGRCSAEDLPWWELRYQDMQALHATLANSGKGASYCNLILSNVRRVLVECRRLGLMTADDVATVTDVARVPSEVLPAGRHVEADEFRKLMAHLDKVKTAAGARDAAMVATLYATGLRRFEVGALSLADLDMSTGELGVRHAKLGKQRVVWLSAPAVTRIERWLRHRGRRPGALFCATSKTGVAITGQYLHRDTIFQTITRRVRDAGVKHFDTHSLGRTFIGEALDAGVDIATVAKAAGHANVQMTFRYDRRGLRRVADIANSVPDF